jgi:ribosomal protein S24E
LSDKKNALFERREAVGKFATRGHTRSRKDMIAELSKKLGCNENCISISKIEHKYGRKLVEIDAKIYNSPEALKKKAPKHEHTRTHGKAAPTPEDAAKKAKKAKGKKK